MARVVRLGHEVGDREPDRRRLGVEAGSLGTSS